MSLFLCYLICLRLKAELTLTLQVAGWVFCTFPPPRGAAASSVQNRQPFFLRLLSVLPSELVGPNPGSGASLPLGSSPPL